MVRLGLIGLAGLAVLGLLAVVGSYLYIAPGLPSIEALRDIRLQVPLRVYSRDLKLIAEFGEKKRTPLRFYETPDQMIKAVLAAEDDRFFEHPGVDYQGILRAIVNLVLTGEKSQGGSTITMQVARNFFLSREKTYFRKLSEIYLALKIDHELTKEEILELYLNKIYLGNRAYGIAAAAHTYYGKQVADLTLSETAMIAGLPKAPSRYNPIANPARALLRRDYVLRRMHELNFITDEQFQAALQEPDDAEVHGLSVELEANYVAEMVRTTMVERYGDQTYTGDFKVITTIDSRLQRSANQSARQALLDYDRRHGYRGPENQVDTSTFAEPDDWQGPIRSMQEIGGLQPALVSKVDEKSVTVVLPGQPDVEIPWDGLSWARRYINDNVIGNAPRNAADILNVGDVIRVEHRPDGQWWLAQIPQVEGALVSLDPKDGSVLALAGGFDFYRSKFNRVIQATRQPGSSFKPFIYSAALEKGFTTATLVNDAPVVFDDPGLESAWRPENYSGKFFGPTRLRVALIHSRNLVSIRVLRSIGVDYALDYVSRFGFKKEELPHNLSLALGSGAITPLELASGYTVFANGGYRVEPYYIDRILGPRDEVMYQATPATVCENCATETPDAPPAEEPPPATGIPTALDAAEPPSATGIPTALDTAEPPPPAPTPAPRVVSAENVYLMTSMLQDVIRSGTGRRARQLRRHDISGKTGTTNEQRDAWFAGFNSDVVTVAWVGFDKTRSLGNAETGGRAALPMWISYMREALKGLPERSLQRPPGLVTVRIDPETGLLARSTQSNVIFETFRANEVPHQYADPKVGVSGEPAAAEEPVTEQLF